VSDAPTQVPAVPGADAVSACDAATDDGRSAPPDRWTPPFHWACTSALVAELVDDHRTDGALQRCWLATLTIRDNPIRVAIPTAELWFELSVNEVAAGHGGVPHVTRTSCTTLRREELATLLRRGWVELGLGMLALDIPPRGWRADGLYVRRNVAGDGGATGLVIGMVLTQEQENGRRARRCWEGRSGPAGESSSEILRIGDYRGMDVSLLALCDTLDGWAFGP
jgi:hypothetical protein